MIRAAGAAALLLCSCSSWPGLEDPSLSIAPRMSLLKMQGRTRMQSGAPPANNLSSGVERVGAGERDEELGLRIGYGDGFSGFEAEYMFLDTEATKIGQTEAPWGSIPFGVDVRSKSIMDEIRLRYIAGLFSWTDEDEENWFKAGLGAQFTHREMNFTITQDGTDNSQKIEIKDDLSPMLAARLAGGRGPWSVQADFAINDDWAFGTGNLEGRFTDMQARANYYFEDQDLTLFAGYRRFEIPATGNEGDLRYDVDFTLDGLFFGFSFQF